MDWKQILRRKKQTAVKGRSAALIITIAVHLILLLGAGTFVAMKVIERSETKFEGKQIVRPKMKIKKLQVPVKIEQQVKRQTPNLSQRVTAASSVKTKSVDFKMPEMGGFGTGGSVNIGGSGFGGSLGFATTQLNVFGLKSTGEKILFILDSTRDMLADKVGGIPAYTIIKDELINLISNLPPTALFNVVVCERHGAQAFSSELSPASDANIARLKAWLGPLNSKNDRIGFSTLPFAGTRLEAEKLPPIYNDQPGWPAALAFGIRKGVDSIYWLGTDDIMLPINPTLLAALKKGETPPSSLITPMYLDYDSYPGGQPAWDALVARARKEHQAENARRKAQGMPMQVISGDGDDYALVEMVFPKEQLIRRVVEHYWFTLKEVLGYIDALKNKYSSQNRAAVSIGLKKKELSFNVIHFVPRDVRDAKLHYLKDLPGKLNGKYLQIRGLAEIQAAATVGK